MSNKELNLPRKYKIKKDTPEKYHKYEGKPKMSYSQYNSWTDIDNPSYKLDYVLGYMLGHFQPGNPYSDFGSAVGEFLETKGKKVSNLLNEEDIKILTEIVNTLSKTTDAVYEREVVLDWGTFITQGFIDLDYSKDDYRDVVDFKTGNLQKKKSYYGGDKYNQTTLYCKSLIEEGVKIKNSGVYLIDRSFEGTFEEPILHLSGKAEVVPTPYSEGRFEKFAVKMRNCAEEISEVYTTIEEFKKLTIEV